METSWEWKLVGNGKYKGQMNGKYNIIGRQLVGTVGPTYHVQASGREMTKREKLLNKEMTEQRKY